MFYCRCPREATVHSLQHPFTPHFTLLTMLRLLCLLMGLAATVSGQCTIPFHKVGEGCYYFSLEYDITMTWIEARQYCHNMGSDVDLAVLDYLCDDFVNLANYLLMADAFATLTDMHVGASGTGASRFWVDGRPLSLSSSHWHTSHPTSGSGCVALQNHYFNGHERIYLHTHDCSYVRHFICQQNNDVRH